MRSMIVGADGKKRCRWCAAAGSRQFGRYFDYSALEPTEEPGSGSTRCARWQVHGDAYLAVEM